MTLCLMLQIVTLRDEAVVGAAYVMLSDVVAEAPLAGALAHVYLGRAADRVITADDVRHELALRGIPGVTVAGMAVHVRQGDPVVLEGRERFASMVAFEVRSMAAVELRSVEMDELRVHVTHVDPVEDDAASRITRVVRMSPGVLGIGEYFVEVNDAPTVRVVARVTQLREIGRTTRALPRGHKITPNDFEKVKVECDPASDYAFAVGYLPGGKTREKIEAGAPIRERDVSLRPIVTRGETVKARSKFMIVDATAVEDGAIGEIVTLEFVETKKRVAGRVISANEVEIVEE